MFWNSCDDLRLETIFGQKQKQKPACALAECHARLHIRLCYIWTENGVGSNHVTKENWSPHVIILFQYTALVPIRGSETQSAWHAYWVRPTENLVRLSPWIVRLLGSDQYVNPDRLARTLKTKWVIHEKRVRQNGNRVSLIQILSQTDRRLCQVDVMVNQKVMGKLCLIDRNTERRQSMNNRSKQTGTWVSLTFEPKQPFWEMVSWNFTSVLPWFLRKHPTVLLDPLCSPRSLPVKKNCIEPMFLVLKLVNMERNATNFMSPAVSIQK